VGFANLKGKGLKFMCKEIDKFADELSSEERTKAAAMLLKMGCKAKDTVKMLMHTYGVSEALATDYLTEAQNINS
jgi:hypothetical protein